MLKHKITAAEFAAFPEVLKAYYKQEGNDYLLQTDTATELQNANTRLKIEKDGLQNQVTGLTTNITTLTAEVTDLRSKKSDVLSLENTHKAQVAGLQQSHETQLKKKDTQLHKLLVTNTAAQIAANLAGENAHLLQPVIEKRLAADLTADEPFVYVIDEKGVKTDVKLNLQDATKCGLSKELVDSKKFSAILIASKASGSTGSNNNSRPTGIPKDKKFNELSESERTAWWKADPKGFNDAASAEGRKI